MSSDDVIHITCEVDSFLFNSGVVLTVHIACLNYKCNVVELYKMYL